MIARFAKAPRRLLLIDGFGAVFSALVLGVVLPRFATAVGMPPRVLLFLATWPCAFALFDFLSYRFAKERISSALVCIAFANVFYCLLSGVFIGVHADKLTSLGYLYFIGEIAIVLLLAYIELSVARRLR